MNELKLIAITFILAGCEVHLYDLTPEQKLECYTRGGIVIRIDGSPVCAKVDPINLTTTRTQ
jgi:hypothetical protein